MNSRFVLTIGADVSYLDIHAKILAYLTLVDKYHLMIAREAQKNRKVTFLRQFPKWISL